MKQLRVSTTDKGNERQTRDPIVCEHAANGQLACVNARDRSL